MTMSAAVAERARGTEPVTREEFEQVIAAHQAYLSHSRNGSRASLQSRLLSCADFSNRNLTGADFTGSSLTHAILRFANFSRATLYCCDMTAVDARYGNFESADMRGVTLNGSNLSHAKLDHSDFRSGRLMKRGNAGGIESVVDRNGSAQGVDFSYCSLSGATFEGADLKGADFTGAIILGTRFSGARLTEVSFKGAIITDVDLTEFHLPAEAFTDCVLPPSASAMAQKPKLMFQLNAHQSWVDSDARLGTCAIFDGQDLRPLASVIGKFKLTAISARKAIAAGVDFSCAELQGANFAHADLRGASFEGADLRGVHFSGALLHHAKFLGADMRPLQLKSGDWLPCKFDEGQLTREQREEAIFE
jgi:uncharacterized protein YjbI with pentapeptide repeats